MNRNLFAMLLIFGGFGESQLFGSDDKHPVASLFYAVGVDTHIQVRTSELSNAVHNICLDPRWFAGFKGIQYQSNHTETSVTGVVSGVDALSLWPVELSILPTNTESVSLRILNASLEDRDAICLNLELKTKDRPLFHEEQHRCRNAFPFLFGISANVPYVERKVKSSIVRTGGPSFCQELVKVRSARDWEIRVSVRSLLALFGSGESVQWVDIVPVFCERLHTPFNTDYTGLLSKVWPPGVDPILIRSVNRLHVVFEGGGVMQGSGLLRITVTAD